MAKIISIDNCESFLVIESLNRAKMFHFPTNSPDFGHFCHQDHRNHQKPTNLRFRVFLTILGGFGVRKPACTHFVPRISTVLEHQKSDSSTDCQWNHFRTTRNCRVSWCAKKKRSIFSGFFGPPLATPQNGQNGYLGVRGRK
jgi:hypothetical protein